ncbi:MAG: head decoration protein [Deltaproteobacteria bacterium]|jgi:hypothetical protein|nr:head decoration protein [Deltaproteobacteria bacterium]
MKNLGTYQRRAFLKDHPPVLARVLLGSTGTETTVLSGTVLGNKDGKHFIYASDQTASCILAEDTTVPASGDQWAMAYVHAAVVAPELIWDEGVSAEQQKTALTALRGMGIYASEA